MPRIHNKVLFHFEKFGLSDNNGLLCDLFAVFVSYDCPDYFKQFLALLNIAPDITVPTVPGLHLVCFV